MEGTKEERRESGAPLLARCSGHSDPMFVSGEKRGSRAPESASNVTLWTQEDARGPESPLSMPTKTLQGKFDVRLFTGHTARHPPVRSAIAICDLNLLNIAAWLHLYLYLHAALTALCENCEQTVDCKL